MSRSLLMRALFCSRCHARARAAAATADANIRREHRKPPPHSPARDAAAASCSRIRTRSTATPTTKTTAWMSPTTSRPHPQEQQYDDGYDPNAYQQFESQLSPYGAWQDVPDYGRVWVPSPSVVGYDFTPYATGGHWVDSEYGWTWVSD